MTSDPGSRPDGPLTVAIDARLEGGIAGGVQHFIEGLASGLAAIDGEDEYVFVGFRATHEWLGAYMGGRASIEVVRTPASFRMRRSVEKRLSRVRGTPDLPALPPEPAQLERIRPDVVHFPMQGGFRTARPNVYNPHDLQHLHLPEFFTPEARLQRTATQRAMCAQASLVAVVSSWVREDVIRQLGVPPEKVAVVPYAPVTSARPAVGAEDAARIARRLELPERFVFYPAQTFPHKNHLRLLEALARLRDEGLAISFVSTGLKNDFHATIEARVRELRLGERVRFLGFVSAEELAAVYARCTAVVIPSLFEAASFPLWEAFQSGAPAACSNVTSLPAQAGDAALVFDPTDTAAIADAVRRLWTDDALRAELARRGRANVARFSWARTARLFRAHYRALAGRALPPDDAELLRAAPLI